MIWLNNMDRLEKYARLLVEMGVHVKENQYLIVEAPVDAYPLVQKITEVAFEKKAKDVIVFYTDSYVDKERALNVSYEQLRTVPTWQAQSRDEYLNQGACSLLIKSAYPYLFEDVSEDASSALQAYTNELRNHIRAKIASDGIQWCIASYPNPCWAKALFPKDDEETALNKMFDAIYDICRIKFDNNPNEDWYEHFRRMGKYTKWLNTLQIDSLHFENSKGTDLVIGLHSNHQWNGGIGEGEEIDFVANIPTEEISTSPDKHRVDGVVYATKPLELGGALVENFWIRFEKGRIVEVGGEKNIDLLKKIIETDEGSHYLGEVALVEYNSPISQSGLLFYNTLYDENASCHLAFGKGFSSSLKGLSATNYEAWEKVNLNFSSIHVDFMFGSEDMKITAKSRLADEIIVFSGGNFVTL